MTKLPFKMLQWSLFAFAVGLCVGFLRGESAQNLFSVDKFEIALDKPFEHPQFMSLHLESFQSRMKSYRGQPIFSIDLDGLRNQILNWSWVAEVEVYRHWPNEIKILIHPKQVVALLLTKNGRLAPVLNDGVVMDPILKGSLPDVPILSGETFSQRKDILIKALVVLEQIPKEGRFSKQNIAEVKYHPKKGFSYQLVQSPVRVQLGEDQVAIKSARVGQVLEYLKNHNLQARVIDANLTKKVLVRLRKDI